MKRRQQSVDNGRSLFDEPLHLPQYPQEELVSCDSFLLDAKLTSGLIMKVNKRLMQSIADGGQPNYSLSRYLNDLTRNINLSIASYAKLMEIENNKNEATGDISLDLVE